MSKAKAIFITAVMAAMLGLIAAGCKLTYPKWYTLMTALLALYGFLSAAVDLCGWLQKESKEPKHLAQDTVEGEPWAHDDENADSPPIFRISPDRRGGGNGHERES